MNKILKFVKLHEGQEFAGVGMGGNIFIVLNSLSNMKKGDRLYVDMETEECACTEHNFSKFNTKNCWEYYYDQMKKVDGKVYSLHDDKPILDYHKVHLGNSELQNRFNNNFKLKDYLQNELDSYYDNNIKGKVTLGVQIRLTDMAHHHNVSSLSTYLIKIQEILNENPNIEQLFLATDDSTVIREVEENVSVKVLYHKGFHRATLNDPHLSPFDRHNKNVRENANYHLSAECIKEIYTLSMCNYLLRADVSSISNVAILLYTKIKKLYQL